MIFIDYRGWILKRSLLFIYMLEFKREKDMIFELVTGVGYFGDN